MTPNGTRLTVAGFNYRTSTVEQRGMLQFGRKEFPEYLEAIKNSEDVEGIIIVSTCNRMEYYMVLKNGPDPFSILQKFYKKHRDTDITPLKDIFYMYESDETSRHLFRVISGLDSMVLGEYQVQGQIKEGYSIACEAGTVEKILHKLFHAAFRTGKKVRSRTKLGEGRQSVSGMAAEIMKNKLTCSDTVALIGVNENTRIMASELTKAGFKSFIFVNRALYKAEMMAEQYGGRAESINGLEKAMFEADAVFTSTGAPGFLAARELMDRLVAKERCPRLIVDMAVPRDIDSYGLPGYVQYHDISSLEGFLEEQKKMLTDEIPEAEKIVEEEVQVYKSWSEFYNSNVMEPYAEKFELIRRQLLEENRKYFPDGEFDKAEKLTKSLVHRMQSVFIRIIMNEQKKNGG